MSRYGQRRMEGCDAGERYGSSCVSSQCTVDGGGNGGDVDVLMVK